MQKLFILLFFLFGIHFSINSQVLNINNNEQEHNQWCWAGCSKTVLEYYNTPSAQQCEIAEWVRTTATFHNFGNTNCCENANYGCNYWNYNWGYSGSIQEILMYFGNLDNKGLGALSQSQITTEIQNNRLFVIRWGWSTGGGHFLVGHGINGDNIYFMNPWYGEGLHIGTYNFVKSGKDNTSSATHTWTSTNVITSKVLSSNEFKNDKIINFYPNPFSSYLTIKSTRSLENATLKILNSLGQEIKQINNIFGEIITINRENISNGVYLITISENNKLLITDKIIICD